MRAASILALVSALCTSFAAAQESEGARRAGIGASAGMLVPSGLVADTIAEGSRSSPTGKRSVTMAFELSFTYRLPFLNSRPFIVLSAGYFPLSGSGERTFANDTDFGPKLQFDYEMHTLPLQAGVGYRIPIVGRLQLSALATFVTAYSSVTTTYRPGSGPAQTNEPQKGWSVGFGLGADLEYTLGPGELSLGVRYLNARTDLGFVKIYDDVFNRELGNVAGTFVLVGYRYRF